MNTIACERGRVIETAGNRVRVRLDRNDSCQTCGLCLFGREGRGMILESENEIGAAPGDRVEMELERRDPLSGAFLLFGLPLLAVLAGAGAGWLLARALGLSPDGGSVLLAAIFLAGTFFLVRRLERRRGRAGEGARVIRVISGMEPTARGNDRDRGGEG
ncbi:MAG: SoxR reducing system RseC family protein [Candidatus Erginobacter occultus]|nr:SoxR reducing system RseC family protein [Candidatus Erginobacter occultus]